MSHPITRVSRPIARLGVALAVAVVAGVAVVLGLAAALDATWDPRGAVILALAAVWIPQALITAARHRRR
ncbi:hypothetical protein [Verrucosispora sp. WMMD1129]|uniref:hypothetical protein n=1 Tax=Verrucosispora sp. WMMD1129 TaxID=3016093 RepID=UPI00249AF544|nr:hypothetical protein [Verrucosispora sp. WMMD1129]WFE44257.1 hypothetical protein O7624_07875 [Verrucosispora sp. WMMD1129]